MRAVAGGAGRQVAVEARAVGVVDERDLLVLAHLAAVGRGKAVAGEQGREEGRRGRRVGGGPGADGGVRVPGERGGDLGERDPGEFLDDVGVLVAGQGVLDVRWEVRAVGELGAADGVGVGCQEAGPRGEAVACGQQREGRVGEGRRVEVVRVQGLAQ
ncbi:hypothetical protein AB0J52_13625 [Spirillospora sp. NPDC049652]